METTYYKMTFGYVEQEYVNGKVVSQRFIAGDQVEYEDEDGNSVDPDTNQEGYFPLDMVQPEE